MSDEQWEVRDNGEVMIGVFCSRVRVEEKLIFEALKKRGMNYERVDPRDVSIARPLPEPLAGLLSDPLAG